MDAKLSNAAVCLTVCFLTQAANGATFRTANFEVTAPTEQLAQKVGKCAEVWREDLAIQWLGEKLPNWYKPCPISVKVGQIGAGGSTTFTFDNGEVFGWRMKVQGSEERILDSVIPHEVNHTIFASHFRRPLPRWADEGAATLFEHRSEQARQLNTLNRVVKTSKRIPLQELLTIREYPEAMEDVLTLYAEGYSLASFLMRQKKGENARKVYLDFLEDAMRSNWDQAIRKHYGFENVQSLERDWTGWILAGSPNTTSKEEVQVASTDARAEEIVLASNAEPANVIRFQSPEPDEPLAMIPRQLRSKPAVPDEKPVRTVSRGVIRSRASSNPESSGASDLRPSSAPMSKLAAPPLPRTSLTPTNDGINSNPRAKAYQFPQMRAF
jgi:hypothetical protein